MFNSLPPSQHPYTHIHSRPSKDQAETDMLTAHYHSPYTGDGNWTNGPSVFPHNIVLRKVVTGCQVISGPLARSTGRAGELISQVFMGLTGCADPAAVLTWETGM